MGARRSAGALRLRVGAHRRGRGGKDPQPPEPREGRHRPAGREGERKGRLPEPPRWRRWLRTGMLCGSGPVFPFPSSPRGAPFSSGPAAAVRPWPSPRTTPRTTSPASGTEMASRSPDPTDTSLSKGSIPSF